MKTTELLLLANSVLLGIISLLFLLLGYFLKDLDKDFKLLIERVNNLYTNLYSHVHVFDSSTKVVQHNIDQLERRITQLKKTTHAPNATTNE
jgi:hypothetical protein